MEHKRQGQYSGVICVLRKEMNMAIIGYSENTWSSGNVITSTKLNNIEDGILACSDLLDATNTNTLYYASGNHNGIFRGKNLTSVYTVAELHSMISAGTFDDLYIGDYYSMSQTATIDDTDITETVYWVFAGFDCFWGYGSTACTTHHAVMVPLNSFKTTAAMNSTATTGTNSDDTVGAYLGSDMWLTVLPAYATAIQNAWGSSYVLTHQQYLSSTMTSTTSSMAGAGYTGASTAATWTDVTCSLMNEAMVFGTTVCSSSRFDNEYANQFPLFQLAPHYRRASVGGGSTHSASSRNAWWLSCVASSTTFCGVSTNGSPTAGSASNLYGVRPYFLLS